MIKKYWLILLVSLLLSACGSTHSPKKTIRSHPSPKTKVTKRKPVPTRAPSNEQPLKRVPTKLSELSSRKCIKSNILNYLGIPEPFVAEIELTDHSNIIILQNPYSNSDGIYIRVIKDNNHSSILELYKNGIQFVSERWYKLLDICQ